MGAGSAFDSTRFVIQRAAKQWYEIVAPRCIVVLVIFGVCYGYALWRYSVNGKADSIYAGVWLVVAIMFYEAVMRTRERMFSAYSWLAFRTIALALIPVLSALFAIVYVANAFAPRTMFWTIVVTFILLVVAARSIFIFAAVGKTDLTAVYSWKATRGLNVVPAFVTVLSVALLTVALNVGVKAVLHPIVAYAYGLDSFAVAFLGSLLVPLGLLLSLELMDQFERRGAVSE